MACSVNWSHARLLPLNCGFESRRASQTIMKLSNKIPDVDRHYLNNLIQSGGGEVPDEEGKVSSRATHKFILEKGFIIGAVKILRREKVKGRSQTL